MTRCRSRQTSSEGTNSINHHPFTNVILPLRVTRTIPAERLRTSELTSFISHARILNQNNRNCQQITWAITANHLQHNSDR